MAKVLLRTAWLNSNFRTMLKATIVLAKYLTWDFLVRNRKLLIPARTYKSNENTTLPYLDSLFRDFLKLMF